VITGHTVAVNNFAAAKIVSNQSNAVSATKTPANAANSSV
jgi:hypothetical protein